MKKLFFALMACVAMFAFTACNESVESQIFDLSFDASATATGNAMLYQMTYEPIIIDALSKVAQPVTEGSKTFMLNSTPTAAKKLVKEAFDGATAAAQKAAGDAPSSIEGIKVMLHYSSGSNQQKVLFAEYTFK